MELLRIALLSVILITGLFVAIAASTNITSDVDQSVQAVQKNELTDAEEIVVVSQPTTIALNTIDNIYMEIRNLNSGDQQEAKNCLCDSFVKW